jgi:NAD+ synthase (glutamine-hydrolysing)
VRKCGFSKVVLGLSGGIDSALVAAIASDAIGADNVLGVLMPSPYSSDHSVTDALALAKNLGIRHELIKIQPAMAAFDEMLAPLFTGTEFGIAEENLQSRTRGNLLMAIANKFGYLLLSTGNKSEMAVGYCTLYGDMNGGLAVIADVPKTMVFKICHWLNRQQEIIPKDILTKPPSAELRPDQTDQDSLPPYDVLDDILSRIIHKNQSTPDLIESGHDPAVVEQVFKLLHRAEFKRRQAAPGLKITDRAFGTGWRMPIASRW